MPSLACKSSSTYVSSFYISSSSLNNNPSLVISLNDDSEDENTPQLGQNPLLENMLAPQLPRWVRSTWGAASNIVNDPIDQC